MQIKKFIALTLCMVLFVLTGCNNNQQKEETISNTSQQIKEKLTSTEEATQKPQNQKNTITILTTYSGMVSESTLETFNQKLAERGKSYQINIRTPKTPQSSMPSSYQSWLKKEKKQGEGDIIFTGYGDNNIDKTYDYMIEKNMLDCMNDFFKTNQGKQVKKCYPKRIWDMTKYKGKIYGFPMNFEVYQNLMIVDPNKIDISSLPKKITGKTVLSSLKKATTKEDKAILSCSDSILDAMGYICTDIPFLYGVKKGNSYQIKCILDEPNCQNMLQEILSLKTKYTIKGYQTDTSTSAVRFTIYDASAGYGDQVVLPASGRIVNRKTYSLGNNTFIPLRNSYWGIASWSQKKNDAYDFLSLMCQDQELCDLLQNDNNEIISDIPVNTWITSPVDAEPENKQEIFWEGVEQAKEMPFEIAYPSMDDLDEITKKFEKVYVKYEGIWEGKYKNIPKTIQNIKRELKKLGMEDILAKWNRKLKSK